MRTFSLTYSAALARAREARSLISPNPGFEYQLRIWEHCEYDVFLYSNKFGSSVHQEKAAYKAWKKNRDALLGGGEAVVNKAHFAAMVKIAADIGKRRTEASEKAKISRKAEEIEDISGGLNGRGWENVDKMEAEWMRRLITGEHPPF
jgi:hypothetical protein